MKGSLQQLIATLDPAEKSYFKRQFSGAGNGKLYLRLFDYMAGAANYSDEKAAQKLGVKQIRVLKFRLSDQSTLGSLFRIDPTKKVAFGRQPLISVKVFYDLLFCQCKYPLSTNARPSCCVRIFLIKIE